MRDFLLVPHWDLSIGPLDLMSCTLPLAHSYILFSLLTISGIYLWCWDLGGWIVLNGRVRDFHFSSTGIWTGYLWISNPALSLHATMTSSFHLWYFQEFNSGAEGLLLALVWLDLLENFFFAWTGIWTGDLWISSPTLYHCTTVTSGFHLWQFQVFNSGFLDIGGWIILIGPVRDFLFCPQWDLNSRPLDL